MRALRLAAWAATLIGFHIYCAERVWGDTRLDPVAAAALEEKVSVSIYARDILVSNFTFQIDCGLASRKQRFNFWGGIGERETIGQNLPDWQRLFGHGDVVQRNIVFYLNHGNYELTPPCEIIGRGLSAVFGLHRYRDRISGGVSNLRGFGKNVSTHRIFFWRFRSVWLGEENLSLESGSYNQDESAGDESRPQAYYLATATPPDGGAKTNKHWADDKQPNDGGFHAYSLHDVKMTALAFSFAGFGLGTLFGNTLALSGRGSRRT
ncbi:hypothetical protein SAMN05444321_5977 [Bradyrhizobium lablabi]|nr:hypothetical protein SAMN05444321_5977 [Bradyrhizobium lablabi]